MTYYRYNYVNTNINTLLCPKTKTKRDENKSYPPPPRCELLKNRTKNKKKNTKNKTKQTTQTQTQKKYQEKILKKTKKKNVKTSCS